MIFHDIAPFKIHLLNSNIPELFQYSTIERLIQTQGPTPSLTACRVYQIVAENTLMKRIKPALHFIFSGKIRIYNFTAS